MKKGFTLIEIIGVIILLGFIALIAFPSLLKLVKNSNDKLTEATKEIILTAASQYVNKHNDEFKNINGSIYCITVKQLIAESYLTKAILNEELTIDTCVKVDSNNDKYEYNITNNCESLINETIKPTIDLTVVGNPFNEQDWSNKDFYVKVNVTDNESGPYGYKWCVGIDDCSPETFKESTNANVLVLVQSENAVLCAIGLDKARNESTKVCESYKLDKTPPTVTPTESNVTITKGDSNQVSSYFTVSYSISGGTLSCSPVNTSGLAVGTKIVTCIATGGNGLQTTSSKSITVQALEYADNSGANKPILYDKMIPVTWNGSSWVYADKSQQWYNYDNKEWANAVVLKSGVTKSVGQVINIDTEVDLMYVWIPRYKYTIFNGNNESKPVQQIDVVFESGTAKTGTVTCTTVTSGSGSTSENCGTVTNGTSTYTHPAFTFGGKELTGIWVGKFEVSTKTACTATNDVVGTECDLTTLGIQIKPNVTSWRGARVTTFYTSIKNITSQYGLSNTDSHMMKNMEWGAVAYLTQSKYGRCTSGMCTEVSRNNSSDFYTGRSDGTSGSGTSSSASGTYQYNTTNGVLASTTGNIYGIYDMSGGAWEYVMGNMVNESNQFYSKNAGFGANPPTKYYDSYTYGMSSTTHSRGRLGDATKETLNTYGNEIGGWYNGYASFPNREFSWFLRGGISSYSKNTSIFSFSIVLHISTGIPIEFRRFDGNPSIDCTTRSVITENE